MANGKIHAKDSVIIAAVSAALLTATVGPAAGLACGAGCLAGVAIGPDLDVDGLDANEYRVVKYTLGFGFLFVWFWIYYSWAFKHRGISHWPVIGTATRIAYAVALSWLLWQLLALAGWRIELPRLSTGWTFHAAWGVLGLALSDVAHWARDMR